MRVPPALVDSSFFFNDTATTAIYTLSLHDALPILATGQIAWTIGRTRTATDFVAHLQQAYQRLPRMTRRSEEHTSELQSRLHLVCRLLLEKKKKTSQKYTTHSQNNT